MWTAKPERASQLKGATGTRKAERATPARMKSKHAAGCAGPRSTNEMPTAQALQTITLISKVLSSAAAIPFSTTEWTARALIPFAKPTSTRPANSSLRETDKLIRPAERGSRSAGVSDEAGLIASARMGSTFRALARSRSMPLGREEQSPAPSSNYSALLRFLRQRTRAYAPARARNGSPAPAIGPGAPLPELPQFGMPPLSASAAEPAKAHNAVAARSVLCQERIGFLL